MEATIPRQRIMMDCSNIWLSSWCEFDFIAIIWHIWMIGISNLRGMPWTLDVFVQEVFEARGTFELIFVEIQLHAIAHKDRIRSLLEELHEGPGHRERYYAEKNGEEYWRLNLFSIRTDTGDEEISNDCANGDDQGCPHVDEQLCGAVTDEKLSTTAEHQVERLRSRFAKVFSRYSHHYVGIFSQETNYPLETCDQACGEFEKTAHSFAFGHP